MSLSVNQTNLQPYQFNPIVIDTPVMSLVAEKPVEPKPVELTLDEKIATNYYKCDETVQWIRADNAECLPKTNIEPAFTGDAYVVNAPANYSSGNTYGYGYCTWGVANWVHVPNNWGNANTWASSARSQGFTVSNVPRVGAVAQTSAGSLGHVAMVVAVGDGTVTVREMNYAGWNVVSERTTSVDAWLYIYV